MSWAGWWLNWSVCIERIRQRSSAQAAEVRQQVGQLHAALAVRRELPRAGPQRGVLLDEGEAHVLHQRSGSCWPLSSVSFGLGSNRSSCDGPPSMKMKMQRLARGAKCGGRTASGARALRGAPRPAAIAKRDKAQAAGSQAGQELAVGWRISCCGRRNACVTIPA